MNKPKYPIFNVPKTLTPFINTDKEIYCWMTIGHFFGKLKNKPIMRKMKIRRKN
jgi:hypothetical protein